MFYKPLFLPFFERLHFGNLILSFTQTMQSAIFLANQRTLCVNCHPGRDVWTINYCFIPEGQISQHNILKKKKKKRTLNQLNFYKKHKKGNFQRVPKKL